MEARFIAVIFQNIISIPGDEVEEMYYYFISVLGLLLGIALIFIDSYILGGLLLFLSGGLLIARYKNLIPDIREQSDD